VRLWGVVLAIVGLVGCSPAGHTRSTVIKLAYIPIPDNLSDDAQCRELWGNIARYGIEMDSARSDWNQIVVSSAALLVERGCVKRVGRR
jgi:hypothetical protein